MIDHLTPLGPYTCGHPCMSELPYLNVIDSSLSHTYDHIAGLKASHRKAQFHIASLPATSSSQLPCLQASHDTSLITSICSLLACFLSLPCTYFFVCLHFHMIPLLASLLARFLCHLCLLLIHSSSCFLSFPSSSSVSPLSWTFIFMKLCQPHSNLTFSSKSRGALWYHLHKSTSISPFRSVTG